MCYCRLKTKKHLPIHGGLFNRVVSQLKAVDHVSFVIEKGKTMGLVGESGCGKSTLGRAVLRLHEPTDGAVILDGIDITKLESKALVDAREDMQIIFQEPYASLSPRRTIQQTLLEPMETIISAPLSLANKKLKGYLILLA